MYNSSLIFSIPSLEFHMHTKASAYLALLCIPFCELYLDVMVLGLGASLSTGDIASI
jgi:hypothetical protein